MQSNEFATLQRQISKLEQRVGTLEIAISKLAIVSVEEPKHPREGLPWFNPADQKLKIWRKVKWTDVN